MSIVEMRSVVADLLQSQGLGEVWEYVPGEVTAYPCLVVGRVSASPSLEAAVVFNQSLDVHVCGRPQSDDAQDELDKLADQTWVVLGGTRTRKHMDLVIAVTSIIPETIAIAGDTQVPAYAITVESSATTC